MHYYKRNIGDYSKKAGRLSMLEHGAYTLLLDACYDRERFPTEAEAIEWCWARNDDEVTAVKFVLARFFIKRGDVYVQNRIEEELADYQEMSKTNKRIATEREEKRTKRARSVNEALKNSHEPPPNHKPLTNNQEPLTNNHSNSNELGDVDELNLNAWHRWVDYRKAIRKPLKPASMLAAQRALAGFGCDQLQVVEQSIANGWQGLFALKEKSHEGGGNPGSETFREREFRVAAERVKEFAPGIADRRNAKQIIDTGVHDVHAVEGN